VLPASECSDGEQFSIKSVTKLVRFNGCRIIVNRVTGSPRRGCSDSDGPEKRSTLVTDPFAGEGAERSPVSLGNSLPF
jgi:hypothetical protein